MVVQMCPLCFTAACLHKHERIQYHPLQQPSLVNGHELPLNVLVTMAEQR
jgi:hypothetical protein